MDAWTTSPSDVPVPVAGHDFVESQVIAIRTTFATMGIFGLAGSLFVILSFVIFPQLRSFNKKLVMCLAISDLLSSVADIMSFGFFSSKLHASGFCTVQAILIQYSEVSSFIWSLIIAIHLYVCAVHNVADETAKRLMPLYAVCGFLVPGLPVLVVGIKNGFGNSVIGSHITWCWIRGSFPLYRIVFYYGPMATIWLACLVFYILISRKAAKVHSSAFKTVVIRVSLYILAAVVSNFPALLNRIQNIVDPTSPVFALFILHSIFNPLQGLMNAIVYSSSAPLRKAYRSLLGRWCGCCRDKTGLSNEDVPEIGDEEEEAYQNYRSTMASSTNPSHYAPTFSNGYSTEHATFETEPLLSGNYPNIQNILPHQRIPGVYGSGTNFSDVSDYSDFSSPSGSGFYAPNGMQDPTGYLGD